MLLAIDPGTTKSGIVLMDGYAPVVHAKMDNERVIEFIDYHKEITCAAMEWFESYGMPVGAEVFEAIVWAGRFKQELLRACDVEVHKVPRREEKLNLCGSVRANDATIRRALIDRFARHDKRTGKGTAKHPDWFYGFKADEWMAYAVGVTWMDGRRENERQNSVDV